MATRRYDSVEYLDSEEMIVGYLQCAAEDNNEEFYLQCLEKVARARAINQLAEETGINRQTIYEMFSSSKPNHEVITKVQAVYGNLAKERELAQV